MIDYDGHEPVFCIDVETIPLSGGDLAVAMNVCAVAEWWDKKWSERQLREMSEFGGVTVPKVQDALKRHIEAMWELLPAPQRDPSELLPF